MQNITIENCRVLAKNNNGNFLSNQYINSKSKYLWECKYNHKWMTTYSSIRDGSWCPECSKINKSKKNKISLKQCQELAKKFNGQFLSIECKDSKTKYKWKCDKNHIWLANYSFVKQGFWCKLCLDNFLNERKILEFCDLAKKYNGEIVSTEYTTSRAKYLWKCCNNHEFYKKYEEVKNCKIFCTKCNSLKVTINDCINLATNKKGLFLSTEYISTSTKYEWQCENEHRWLANYENIKKGTWCPECSIIIGAKKRSNNINDCFELARQRHFEFLSKEFFNTKTLYVWKCKNGHVWKASYTNIKKGTECPKCSKKYSKISIEWLTYISKSKNINIQHALNDGEYQIPKTKYRVDGYCKENNTCYEFHGDEFHCNPNKYKKDDTNFLFKKAEDIWNHDSLKKNSILNAGYHYICIWESEWNKIKKTLDKSKYTIDN